MGRIVVVGGGISGLSLAYFLLEKDPSAEISIFESEERAGGKIWTEKSGGFLCEGGVNGFLDNKPRTLELASKIALTPLRSNDASRKRFIYSGGTLHRLPESPPAFLTSALLSPMGRARVIAETVIPGKKKDEETLADFARRRLGREAYEKLIDPMASGIYAGNAEKLSLRACFPKVYDLEANYGGLIRGMLALQRRKKQAGSKEKVGAGPGGVLTSFHDGMGQMVDALKTALGDRLRTGRSVAAAEKKGKGYVIAFSDGTTTEADTLILAAPAYAAAEILRNLDARLSSLISDFEYPSLSVVCFGYRKEKIRSSLDGFGFLIPSTEKRRILGTLWDSSIFPDRVPEGYVLLRSMIGGARASDLAMKPDNEIFKIVQEELSVIMGITPDPDFARLYRHEKAIPQYTVGHLEKLKTIDGILVRHNGLYLAGNAYRGIGVNDCIENSFRLAEKITGEKS